MDKTDVLENKFKNKPYPINRLPSRTKKCDYRWVSKKSHVGKVAKILIYLIAQPTRKDEQVTISREFVKADYLYDNFTRLLPWFNEMEYKADTGNEMTPSVLLNRHHKMYYKYDTKSPELRCVMSNEHPLNSEKLAPFLQIAQTIFQNQKPVSREWVLAQIAEVTNV